jgi:hypothetical protein
MISRYAFKLTHEPLIARAGPFKSLKGYSADETLIVRLNVSTAFKVFIYIDGLRYV